MMNSSRVNPLFGMLPKEMRLAEQAKSGDPNAFVNLYDACVERIYRYVYFMVPNTKAAEGVTLQVFFKAWQALDRYQIFKSSFIVWLYSIAQEQVLAYHSTHKKTADPDDGFPMTIRGSVFRKEFQVIRDGLRCLAAEQQQVLVLKFILGMSNGNIGRVISKPAVEVGVLFVQGLQEMTEYLQETELKIEMKGSQRVFEEFLAKLASGVSILDECWVRYPEYSDQLGPLLETALLLHSGRDVRPLSTFVSFTREALFQYACTYPRRPKVVAMPVFQRMALTFALLITFLVTGTAQAQSALPGEPFYGWKRTSERAWRALSPDPVATDIILAERRLTEWIAVADNPIYNVKARGDYLAMIASLESTDDLDTLVRIVPKLQSQQEALSVAGLPVPELNAYLADVVNSIPADLLVKPTPAASLPVETDSPTRVVPTKTEVSTVVVSTKTEIPTVVPPTQTQVPTVIVPTATAIPTEVLPTATTIPTEVLPTATAIPATIAPTETEAATEIAPTETDTPATTVPTEPPTVEPAHTPAATPIGSDP